MLYYVIFARNTFHNPLQQFWSFSLKREAVEFAPALNNSNHLSSSIEMFDITSLQSQPCHVSDDGII